MEKITITSLIQQLQVYIQTTATTYKIKVKLVIYYYYYYLGLLPLNSESNTVPIDIRFLSLLFLNEVLLNKFRLLCIL